MRILQLRLHAFGPFTEVVIDFSEGTEEGLHIVYGPNEAGKSSALRALRQMLYGIPQQSPDDFVHKYAKMKIGGTLRHSDGTLVDFTRRKGKVNTLTDSITGSPISDSLFQKYLGGIDADTFATMFGIGHTDLVRAGEDITKGGGEVGQALFAAGAGISELRRVQAALQAEAEGLFTPSASTRPINKAISDFKQKMKSLRDAQLPGQEWEAHDRALQASVKRRREVEFELQTQAAYVHRLERIRKALPLISSRREILRELGSYAGAVLLPGGFSERRTKLVADLRVAESNIKQQQQKIVEITNSIQEQVIDQAVIDNGEVIEKCYKELGSYEKAIKDRIAIQTGRDVLRGEAREILSGLRDDLSIDEAEKLRLKKAEMAGIKELGTQYEHLMAKLESARDGISKTGSQVKKVDEQLERVDAPLDIEGLREAVEQSTQYAALEEHYRSELKEVESSLKTLGAALGNQTLWQGALEQLKKLPLPQLETLEVFGEHMADVKGELTRLKTGLHNQEESLIQTQADLRELDLEGDVPTEEDLAHARTRRDEGWKVIRTALAKNSNPGEEGQALRGSAKPGTTVVRAYEESVQKADEVADRLRREAERVARKARLISDREAQEAALDRLKGELLQAEKEMNEVSAGWIEVWKPAEVLPRTPKEMKVWLQNMEGILKRLSEIQERRRKTGDLGDLIEAHIRKLDGCLQTLSEPGSRKGESLTDLLKRSRKVIQRNETIRSKRESLQAERVQRREEMEEAISKQRGIEEEMTQWQGQWEEAIQPLGLGASTVPAAANAVLEDIKDLFDRLKEADILNKRIRGIDREAESFGEKVTALLEVVAKDLRGLSIERAISELKARLTRSRAARSKLDHLEAQRDQEQKKLLQAQKGVEEAQSRLGAMCQEAGCAWYEDLAEAERRSSKRRELETEAGRLERQLHELSGGLSVDDFVTEALQVDPDAVDGQIAALSEKIDSLNKEKSNIDQAIGEERSELRRMDGSSKAAYLAEESQAILARLESDAEKYARLRIAWAVLAQAVERYRQKHQAPVLRLATDLFSRLTVHSFDGIQAEYNEQGNPVLVGVRSEGKQTVGVTGMSDGTTDQLYLALRLASLEMYLEENEPIPFIVDDILIRFDNARAASTLKVLGDLSKKTQVIFFTHHQHLVELAEANLDPSIVFVHHLSS